MTSQLEHAISDLYVAFKGRVLPRLMQGCSCCWMPEDLEHLSRTPLQSLGVKELDSYSISALWTVGSEEDYRHFAPRLLELMTQENFLQHDVIARKFTLAGWRNWSAQEQQAVEAYFLAYWQAALAEPVSWCTASEGLYVLGNVFDDLSPFLNGWLEATEPFALGHLAAFTAYEAPNVSRDFIGNGSWAGRPEQMRQVVDWLSSHKTLARIEQRWLADPEGPAAEALVQTAEYIAPAIKAVRANKKIDLDLT